VLRVCSLLFEILRLEPSGLPRLLFFHPPITGGSAKVGPVAFLLRSPLFVSVLTARVRVPYRFEKLLVMEDLADLPAANELPSPPDPFPIDRCVRIRGLIGT